MPSFSDLVGAPRSNLIFPLVTADSGRVWSCAAYIHEGTGRRHLLGGLDEVGKESLHNAISFVTNNARLILSCLEQGIDGGSQMTPATLYNLQTDVILCLSELDELKCGPSASACAVVALVVALGRCKLVHKETGVTGAVDLRGKVTIVDGVEDKIRGAMNDGMDLFIVPALNLRTAKVTPDIEEYVHRAVKGVSTVVELLQYTIQGKVEGQRR